MEVHHHSHTARKKWTHYFWEFLMLFLAVFCGFMAENLREKVVEHHREKEYAQSLYDDLKVDTAVIQRTMDEKKWITAKFDSALNILSAGTITNDGYIYYIERYVRLTDVFTSQDVTYQQLKSSGNFRYFGDLHLYKELADYYNLYSRYQSVDGRFGFTDENMTGIEAALFNAAELNSLINENARTFYEVYNRPEGRRFEPIVQNKQALKELFLKIADSRNKASASRGILGWLKTKATELINTLQKKYHLK